MQGVYHTQKKKFSGSSLKEVNEQAINVFKSITQKTKRTPYIRCQYFDKEKVFLNIFWGHLHQKHQKDKIRRLKFYNCAIDLIKNTRFHPTTKDNSNNKAEVFHRFTGITPEKEVFYVQIKENKRTRRKDFISVFPELNK